MAGENRWPDLIGYLVLVKQRMFEADPAGPYGYTLPRVGASEERLAQVEAQLGESLDPGYREFLRHADGWPEFALSLQLMGTAELLGGVRATAEDYLDVTLGEAVLTEGDRDQLFGIAVASEDKDVVAVGRPGTPIAGQVVWLAGEEVDRYPSFRDWFEAELEYQRRALVKATS